MTVTTLSSKTTMSDAEWQQRCDLAALYRLVHHYRMTDMIYTHLSARVPGEPNHFLINQYGEMFDEVTASSLVKLDMEGNVVGESGEFNQAGFNIHSGAYLARPDANCVMHTHTRAGVAVAATECGLQPISQHALVIWNELSYYDYGGPGVIETPEDIGNACGASNCVVMRNHGLLTQGHTIQSAFFRMYYLELACQIQADAKAMNEPLRAVSGDVLQASIDVYAERNSADDLGQREWPSLLRMLERQGSNYLA